MRTVVYVDGFNLYFSALKGTPFKWLNLDALMSNLARNAEIERIRYFTAIVKPYPTDPRAPQRQQVYLRALQTLPNLSIHLGSFRSLKKVRREIGTGRSIRIRDSEEKGSDVNLASYLLHDAHLGRFEEALVLTNDSDLKTPIQLVTEELGLRVGVVFPSERPSRDLLSVASFTRIIRDGALAVSQFPETLVDRHGTIRKPPSW